MCRCVHNQSISVNCECLHCSGCCVSAYKNSVSKDRCSLTTSIRMKQYYANYSYVPVLKKNFVPAYLHFVSFEVFRSGIAKNSVILRQNATLLDNQTPTFSGNVFLNILTLLDDITLPRNVGILWHSIIWKKASLIRAVFTCVYSKGYIEIKYLLLKYFCVRIVGPNESPLVVA